MAQKIKEKGISLISFSSLTQNFHKEIFKQVLVPESLPVHTYVVGTLSDLFNIKPYQVTVIFVDSNDRNIILENPETDIGDIRRKTTKCLTKINCDVFIIYCKDRGSQTLPPNQLYNTRLHSIDQHATLVKLKKKNRVFSVYECLHLQQVELLGDCVEQL